MRGPRHGRNLWQLIPLTLSDSPPPFAGHRQGSCRALRRALGVPHDRSPMGARPHEADPHSPAPL